MSDSPIYFNKTRLAPTPSGFLHVGNILSFAITAALAQKYEARILLRIDDLDRARLNPEYLTDIFDTLRFLEIPWDEGPQGAGDFEADFSQLHRMHLYNEALEQLAAGGHVFACTCSRRQLIEAGGCTCFQKQIPLNTTGASWRLYTANEAIRVNDYNAGVVNALLPAEMQHFIVRKKDGFPAYQLTSVIDDLYYGVDLIVRGHDLWASTLAQLQLAKVLGKQAFTGITFYHHPLLLDALGAKLSKSAGAASVHYMQQEGQNAAGVYQHIAALLGFNKGAQSWQQLAQLMRVY